MNTYFVNLSQYIHLLPLDEQISEIDRMIKHYSKKNHPCYNFRNRFSSLKDLKDIKRELLSRSQTLSSYYILDVLIFIITHAFYK